MRPAIALCALVVLLAGCSTPPSGPGSTLDGASAGPADGQGGAAPDNGTVEKPYSFQGSLSPGFCVPLPLGSCVSIHLGTSKSVGAPGESNVTHAKLTLTWTATAPTAETLSLKVQRATPCGDGCWKGKDAVPAAQGKSPLALDAATPALLPGETLIVVVREVPLTPEPTDTWAHPEQAFQVEGTLTVMTKA